LEQEVGSAPGGAEGHAFWRVGVFLSLPLLFSVVSTSLRLNALERKPSASCCLTHHAKCKLEVKKKRESGGKWEALMARPGVPATRRKPSLVFPGDVEEEAHPDVSCLSSQSGSRKESLHRKRTLKNNRMDNTLGDLSGRIRRCV
jgi:hypothetical protein